MDKETLPRRASPDTGHRGRATVVASTPADSRRATILLLTVCALLLAPTLTYRMTVDQGSFAYIGSQALSGKWPYMGTWESDFPGMMFLNAFEILLFGRSLVMFRFFDLLVQLVNAYLIYRIALRAGVNRQGAYLAAVLYCLIYQSYGPWNTAQREGFGLPFVLMGFWLFLTADRRSPTRSALGIGLGFGAAFLFKPTLLALGAFYAPLLFAGRPGRDHGKIALIALAGLLTPAAAIVAFYWAQGGLQQLYEATIAYQSIYTMRLRGGAPALTFWWGNLPGLGRTAGLLAVAYVPFLFRRSDRRVTWMLYLGYLGSLGAVIVQGTFAGYHYIPGLALGAILVGNAFGIVLEAVTTRTSLERFSTQVRLLAVPVVLIGFLPIYMQPTAIESLVTGRFLQRPGPHALQNATVFDFGEDYELAEYLREHTRPSDHIQVWGYESLVYYLSHRDAASRFQITHPLVMRVPGGTLAPMQLAWRREFMTDMRSNRPVYVVVVQRDNWWWAPGERTSEELLDDFPVWRRFIQNRYTLERRIGRFLLYHRDMTLDLHSGPGSHE